MLLNLDLDSSNRMSTIILPSMVADTAPLVIYTNFYINSKWLSNIFTIVDPCDSLLRPVSPHTANGSRPIIIDTSTSRKVTAGSYHLSNSHTSWKHGLQQWLRVYELQRLLYIMVSSFAPQIFRPLIYTAVFLNCLRSCRSAFAEHIIEFDGR